MLVASPQQAKHIAGVAIPVDNWVMARRQTAVNRSRSTMLATEPSVVLLSRNYLPEGITPVR